MIKVKTNLTFKDSKTLIPKIFVDPIGITAQNTLSIVKDSYLHSFRNLQGFLYKFNGNDFIGLRIGLFYDVLIFLQILIFQFLVSIMNDKVNYFIG